MSPSPGTPKIASEHQRLERAKEKLPPDPAEGTGYPNPSDTPALDHQPQNCERMHAYCSEPPVDGPFF